MQRISTEVQLRLFWSAIALLAIYISVRVIRRRRSEREFDSWIPRIPDNDDIWRPDDPWKLPDNQFSGCDVAFSIHAEMSSKPTTSYQFLTRLNNLNDAQLISVYNCFNDRYAKEGHGTLRNWIAETWVFGLNFWNWAIVADERRKLLRRFDDLNLQ